MINCIQFFSYIIHLQKRCQMYNNSIGLGKAISNSKIPRKDLFITSKQWGHYTFEIAKIKFMETLSMLKTDYIDLYLIHWPNHDSKINSQTWKFFEWLYNNKYCRAIGVSNFSRYQLQELLKTCKIKPMVNQVEFHPGLNQMTWTSYPLPDLLMRKVNNWFHKVENIRFYSYKILYIIRDNLSNLFISSKQPWQQT